MQHEISHLLGRYTQIEQFEPDNEIFITIKIQTTHSASLIKSPYQLRKEFPPDHLKKPYLTNQKKYTKKL